MKRIVLFVVVLVFWMGLFGFEIAQVDSLLSIDFQAIHQKGNVAWGNGDYEAALNYWLQVWQRRMDNETLLWNLSIAFGQLNMPKYAGMFLNELLNAGFTDFDRILHSPRFDRVKESEIFQEYWLQVTERIDSQRRSQGYISYIEVPVMIRYRTMLPDNFHPDVVYNIVIFLHGFGGYLNNFNEHATMLQESDFIYVAPQAPYPFEYSSFPFTSFSWEVRDMHDPEFVYSNRSRALTEEYLLALTNELRTKYNVRNVYLAGFSQGGTMTLSIGIRNPDVFSGLISFGGGIWEGLVSAEMKAEGNTTPVLLIHGDQYPPERRAGFTFTYEALRDAGYDINYHVFDGGHAVPKDEFERMVRWMRNR